LILQGIPQLGDRRQRRRGHRGPDIPIFELQGSMKLMMKALGPLQ